MEPRDPGTVGRSALETLLALDNPCRNCVSISEQLLGPLPPVFCFQPKHRAQVSMPGWLSNSGDLA